MDTTDCGLGRDPIEAGDAGIAREVEVNVSADIEGESARTVHRITRDLIGPVEEVEIVDACCLTVVNLRRLLSINGKEIIGHDNPSAIDLNYRILISIKYIAA